MHYFVMLESPNGTITPMVDDDETVWLFDNIIDACDVAEENPLGKSYGYEVFERGTGSASTEVLHGG